MKNISGLTLVEMIITLGLLAIVVSIAVPSYTSFTIRAHRSEGIDALIAASACQERLYSRNNAYSSSDCEGLTQNGHYSVTITTANANQSYTATATPQGNQVKDGCKTLTLNDQGIKKANGSGGDFASKCFSGKGA